MTDLHITRTLGGLLGALCVVQLSCASDYQFTGLRPDVDPGDVTECPFVPVPGTKLSRYDCNPVFTNTDEGWGGDVGAVGFHVTEVLGHPFYQMWYTSSSGGYGSYGMGYAVSSNGTEWDTHEANPLFVSEDGAWDQDSVAGQVVVWDHIDDRYVMAYQGFNLGNQTDPMDDVWGLGIATSVDGLSWEKLPDNPAIRFSDYDLSDEDFLNYSLFGIEPSVAIKPCWPLTINLTDRGAFRGYVAASRWTDLLDAQLMGGEPAACEIYAMDGVDAGTWLIDDAAPVLGSGEPYDMKGVTAASVVELDGVHYMFYVGFEEWYQAGGTSGLISAQKLSLNLATSSDDGVSWQKDPSNPQPIQLTTPGQLGSVGAQVVGSRIHLWVGDNYEGTSGIGYFYYEPGIEPHDEAEPSEE